MKKNKLYTVNKWNQPAFMQEKNLFTGGGVKLKPIQGIPFSSTPTVDLSSTPVLKGFDADKWKAQRLDDYMNSKNAFGLSKKDNPFSKVNLKQAFSKENLGNAVKGAGAGLATAAAGAVGGMAANAISGGLTSKAGSIVGDVGSTVLGAAGTAIGGPIGGAVGSAVGQVLGGVTNALFGEKVDAAKLGRVEGDIAKLNSFTSNAGSFDEIQGPEAVSMDTDVYSGGLFNDVSGKNEELKQRLINAKLFAERSVDNNVLNLQSDQLNNALANYAAFGGPMDFGGGALGLMQQNRYFDTIDKRSEAIAGKGQPMQTGYTGSAKTFADGGLKAAFMDEFGKDPIAAAIRYNQGLEAMAAEREAREAEAAREAEYADMQKRLLQLETSNQGLQALVAAQSVPTTIETAEETAESLSTPSAAAYNSNWDYIEDQLRKSGKFNSTQIAGIKYNLQRESGINPEAVGDGGEAFGLGQWHRGRQPKDRSIEGQTRHLIETLSNYDGKNHWIGKDNYEGFMNARTPEEAHYYIAKGYERPHKDIVAKVKRDSDMSLKKLNAFGGELGTNGTDFTNGLLYIDEGGTHEENPLEGVPMGLDPQGIPNLVEEGETVYNDYVFSDRMKVPFFMYKELGLGGAMKKKGKGMSFADASKKLAQESEQRPNDPISQAGLEASLAKLAEVQEAERMRKQGKEYMGLEEYACGGRIGRKYAKGATLKKYDYYRSGNDGLAAPTGFKVGKNGKAYDYTDEYRQLVSQLGADDIRAWAASHPDDPSLKSFIAKGNDLSKLTDEQWRTGATDGKYGFMHHVAQRIADETPRDIPAEFGIQGQAIPWEGATGLPVDTRRPLEQIAQDKSTPERTISVKDNGTNLTATYNTVPTTRGGITDYIQPGGEYTGLDDSVKTYPTWMRYAPAVGSGIMALTDALGLTNKPDYTYADKLEAAANSASVAPNIGFKPIGNYLTYRPMDIWFEQNRMDANARATDRAIMNSTSPSRMAGLLASGYNNQIANGNLYRQALEYNDAKRKDVAGFNRSTDMFNSQMGLEAAMANARYQQAARQMGLSGLAQAAAMRDSIDARVGAARSANLTNFLNNLGNIGRENFAMNQINTDRSRNYYGRLNGDVSGYKRKGSCGGKLNRK